MDEYQTLSHTKWDCKHHIIFIPKCRRRTSYSELWKYLGELFRLSRRSARDGLRKGI